MTRTDTTPRTSLPLVALVAAATIVIGGCAAKGATLGDEIGAAGAQYAKIADRWEDGENKVAKGRKLVRRGRDRTRDAEDDITEGEALVREGEAEMAESRRRYEQLKARSPALVGPAPGS